MLGTLTLAAGSAVAGWLLQHAYQHMRYSFYEREDAAMLAPGADPEQRRSWLTAVCTAEEEAYVLSWPDAGPCLNPGRGIQSSIGLYRAVP